jgi:hypothetical protein
VIIVLLMMKASPVAIAAAMIAAAAVMTAASTMAPTHTLQTYTCGEATSPRPRRTRGTSRKVT